MNAIRGQRRRRVAPRGADRRFNDASLNPASLKTPEESRSADVKHDGSPTRHRHRRGHDDADGRARRRLRTDHKRRRLTCRAAERGRRRPMARRQPVEPLPSTVGPSHPGGPAEPRRSSSPAAPPARAVARGRPCVRHPAVGRASFGAAAPAARRGELRRRLPPARTRRRSHEHEGRATIAGRRRSSRADGRRAERRDWWPSLATACVLMVQRPPRVLHPAPAQIGTLPCRCHHWRNASVNVASSTRRIHGRAGNAAGASP